MDRPGRWLVVLVVFALLSVCTATAAGPSGGPAGQDRELTGAASAATVDESVLDGYGYERTRNRSLVLEERVEVGGETVVLRGTSPAVEYRRTVDLGILGGFPAGAFGTIALPAFERNGTALNPVGDAENPELAGLVEERFPSLRFGRPVGNETLTVLGAETRVTAFDGRATVGNASVEVAIYVAKVRSGEDYVVAVGVHPAVLRGERERLFDLFRAVEHPGSGADAVIRGG